MTIIKIINVSKHILPCGKNKLTAILIASRVSPLYKVQMTCMLAFISLVIYKFYTFSYFSIKISLGICSYSLMFSTKLIRNIEQSKDSFSIADQRLDSIKYATCIRERVTQNPVILLYGTFFSFLFLFFFTK